MGERRYTVAEYDYSDKRSIECGGGIIYQTLGAVSLKGKPCDHSKGWGKCRRGSGMLFWHSWRSEDCRNHWSRGRTSSNEEGYTLDENQRAIFPKSPKAINWLAPELNSPLGELNENLGPIQWNFHSQQAASRLITQTKLWANGSLLA